LYDYFDIVFNIGHYIEFKENVCPILQVVKS